MPITINGSTGISGVDGSAGTPALIGSDADTGLVFAAGQVSASVNGTAGNVPLVQGTAQASTSGTSIDFTGIPSWAKRITVALSGVSTNGSSIPMVRLGAGSFETTGYDSVASTTGTGVATAVSTAGFLLNGGGAGGASAVKSGVMILCHVSGNTWAASFTGASGQAGQAGCYGGGTKTLGGTLDRIRVTTVNGTDTFDAGLINILYE